MVHFMNFLGNTHRGNAFTVHFFELFELEDILFVDQRVINVKQALVLLQKAEQYLILRILDGVILADVQVFEVRIGRLG